MYNVSSCMHLHEVHSVLERVNVYAFTISLACMYMYFVENCKKYMFMYMKCVYNFPCNKRTMNAHHWNKNDNCWILYAYMVIIDKQTMHMQIIIYNRCIVGFKSLHRKCVYFFFRAQDALCLRVVSVLQHMKCTYNTECISCKCISCVT